MTKKFNMTWEEIAAVIEEIMCEHGPDGHCDGWEILTDFAYALQYSRGKTFSVGKSAKKHGRLEVSITIPVKTELENIKDYIENCRKEGKEPSDYALIRLKQLEG